MPRYYRVMEQPHLRGKRLYKIGEVVTITDPKEPPAPAWVEVDAEGRPLPKSAPAVKPPALTEDERYIPGKAEYVKAGYPAENYAAFAAGREEEIRARGAEPIFGKDDPPPPPPKGKSK